MELLQPDGTREWYRPPRSRMKPFKWLEKLLLSNTGIFAGFGVFFWVLVKASTEMMLDLKWKGITYHWSRKQTVEKIR